MTQPKAFHLPRFETHPLILLLSFGLALLLGGSVSVINIAVSMGRPMALSVFFINFLSLVGGILSLSSLYLMLRKSPIPFGTNLLIAAYVAISLIFWQVWEYPTIDGAFYRLRDNLGDLNNTPPEPSAHILAIMASSLLFYAGFEYAFLPTYSFFKASLQGKLSILALVIVAVSLVFISYPKFSTDPKLAYIGIPVLFGLASLILRRFNSAAALLSIFAVNFGSLFLLTYLAYWLTVD